MHIRPIGQEDIEPALELIGAMIAEGSEYTNIGYMPTVMRTWLFAALNDPNTFFCNVAEHEGEVVGGMLGMRGPFTFSDTQMALEMGIYLQPKFRGGFTAVRLIKKFEEWAKSQGCARVQVGATIGINDSMVAKIYERLGYRVSGPVLRKEINYGV